jgi:hypothetical protein
MSAREIGTLVRGLIEAAKGRRRRPSERNLRIYEEVRVEGADPQEVAAYAGITRRRVAAICQQVERWFAEQEPWRLGDLQGAAGRRAERLAGRRRLEYVYSWAIRGLRTSGQTLTEGHTTTKESGGREFKQVHKDKQFNVQWLKVAKGAAEKLLALSDEEEPGEVAPPARVARGEAVLRAAACLRRAIRQETRQANPEKLASLVEQVVLALAGDAPAAAPIGQIPHAAGADGNGANYSSPEPALMGAGDEAAASGEVAKSARDAS